MRQANSAEEHKLVSSFEAIKRTLLQDNFKDRLDKPLAYWALPNDRRLPLAFLGRSLGELLATPFDELTATRGIGQKKISSLVRLLHRATSDHPPAVPYGIKELAEEISQERAAQPEGEILAEFDPTVVSEALWVQWCETVKEFRLDHEPLGKLAPSLQSLPTVIWLTPLGEYVGRPLSEIRQLKTHGEKRVRVVLEVFHAVHELLSNARNDLHLSLSLAPREIPPIEYFIHGALHKAEPVGRQTIVDNVTEPLLNQILVDSGDIVHQLARQRLGVGAPEKSVREISTEMGVTRARVYQLLEDCSKVIEVRWPDGALMFERFGAVVSHEGQPMYTATRQLFFSEKGELSAC
jgi:hypothetical protein